MKKDRKKYAPEFKEEAVKLITEQWISDYRGSPKSRSQSNHAGSLET